MRLIKEICSLAQHLDNIGLRKEADTLDDVAGFILKKSHEDGEEEDDEDELLVGLFRDLLEENMEYLRKEKGLTKEEALRQAVTDIQRLREEDFGEVTEDQRQEASNLMWIHQVPNFSSRDESSDN